MAGPKATMFLQQYSQVSDGLGGFTSTWSEVAKLRGPFTTVDKWEKFISDATRTKVTHYFMPKYDRNISISESDRLRHGADIYEIILVDNVGLKNRFWEISLKKVD